MGCASSKRIEAAVDVYRPSPASFAVFNINGIDEPWVVVDNKTHDHQDKPSHVPAPILEKLNTFENEAPHSWDEVSKALQDLKPTLHNPLPALPPPPPPNSATPQPPNAINPPPTKHTPRKSSSFHTLEELEAKLTPKPAPISKNTLPKAPESTPRVGPVTRTASADSEGLKPVKENIFLVRDRLEREKEGKPPKWDPLSEYPEKCPPGGADSVVVYTTSVRGVRRTYEDCTKVKGVLELQRVVFDERDVSLHGEFLKELREVMGEEEVSVPRVFVKGRYIGGAEELVELNDSGRLGRILNRMGAERGLGRLGCEGCGGARFVPCLECGGSRKVVVGADTKERCPKCNENGLVHCPACL